MKSLKKEIVRTEDLVANLKDEITLAKRELSETSVESKQIAIKQDLELKNKELIKLCRKLKKLREEHKFQMQAEKERERAVLDSEGQGKE